MASSEEVKAPAAAEKRLAPAKAEGLRLVGKELHEGGAYDHEEGIWKGGRLVRAYPTKALAREAIFERAHPGEAKRKAAKQLRKDR